MHIATLSLFLALLSMVRASLDAYSPFSSPFTHADLKPLIVKRQTCPSNYHSCSSFGYSNACCPVNTNCALDAAGHIACCPFYAVCTGTVGAPTGTATSTTGGYVLGATTTTTSSATTASSATFIAPTTGVQGGGSTVPNAAFPFVYIPTWFANPTLCSSYWTSCQIESASCFSSLAGATGVTIVGPGVTSPGASGASSICSELSASACYDLELPTCAYFPAATGATTTATTGQYIQTTVAGAGGSRVTGCAEIMYALGVGAVVGAAGVLA